MTLRFALLLLAFGACVTGAGAEEPAWVADWLKVPLPVHSAEDAHRAAYRGRAATPAKWKIDRTRELRFEVLAAESGEPLAGVLLSSWQGRQHGFSAKDGTLGPVAWYVGGGGAAFVMVSAPGRRTADAWIRPDGNTVRIALVADTRRRLRARVVDAGGQPAAGCAWALSVAEDPAPSLGAGVEATLLAPSAAPRAGRSDAEGWCELRVSGAATLRASLPNVGCAELALAEHGKPQASVTLQPKGGQVVGGVVVDSEGNPLAGATLTDTLSAATVTTDAEGRFRFAGCLEGLYCFSVLGPDAEEATDVTAFTYAGQPRDALTVVAR